MRRPRIILALLLPLLAPALLAGCSALRFGYNQAPELAFWWLDGYADFDDTQARDVRARLGQWFAWHRRTQLPDYAALLARMRAEVAGDTTPERVCRWWSELREHAERAVDQALPQAAEVALTLQPAQIRHIERRQARVDAELRRDHLDPDPARRLERVVERSIERAETVYGTLDERQRALVARLQAASPFDPEAWLAERMQRQQEMVQVLRRLASAPADRDAALAALRAQAERVARSPREAYRRYQDRLENFNCGFAAQLHNATTPAQRQAAAARFKGWENDVRALAAAPD
ncbi:DUF6279 family lipoprotein [Piscinibacter sp.]|uniref:DUF6279 family lipoprotein n=1 Tax=Piscinibacter sp. TaxID=1903157 RepID=UPI0039E4F5A9